MATEDTLGQFLFKVLWLVSCQLGGCVSMLRWPFARSASVDRRHVARAHNIRSVLHSSLQSESFVNLVEHVSVEVVFLENVLDLELCLVS